VVFAHHFGATWAHNTCPPYLAKSGLIAFFDILGYSEFLENNEPQVAAISINGFLDRIDSFYNSKFVNQFHGKDKEIIGKIAANVNHLIISDSILITLECDIESDDYSDYLLVFLLYCSSFTKELFLFGLPLRGCIEYGEFYMSKNTFAGKPIINAYKGCESLNLAGCLIEESVSLDRLDENKKYNETLYFNCFVPMKNEEKEGFLLNYILENKSGELMSKLRDPRQFVYNSFSSHNKRVGLCVYKKIMNTEMFIRQCIARTIDFDDEK
jgi:hypothetical protein